MSVNVTHQVSTETHACRCFAIHIQVISQQEYACWEADSRLAEDLLTGDAAIAVLERAQQVDREGGIFVVGG